MLPPGHIAGGFLAAKIASHFIPELDHSKYLLLSSFFGFFPDLDFFFAFFKAKKFISREDINHRQFVTHAPLLYLVVFTALYSFPNLRLFAWTFILGTWSHFLLDSISSVGIAWLYPFTSKLYNKTWDSRIAISEQGFLKHWTTFVREYMKIFSFKAEMAIILVAILVYWYS
ncbi:MAG TPA: metal-dependent hydrolase [Patescibacteria group bacterium]|jgi:membrane-bound metal-dependent hydrolase YbcI (DUF457 family)|nr:metal-dependent hydrolase [Patescibacteria group bacterium]